MNLRNKLAIGVGIVLLVAATAGITALATSNYGTQSDPLVTLSYLYDSVMPQIREELGSMLEDKSLELEERFAGLIDEAGIDDQGTQVDGDLRFSIVTLSKGQTVSCAVGTEIMLRIGTAVTYGEDNPRLIDTTTGEAVPYGSTELVKNHMYAVTINGNGIKATRDNTKIYIRGVYTVE